MRKRWLIFIIIIQLIAIIYYIWYTDDLKQEVEELNTKIEEVRIQSERLVDKAKENEADALQYKNQAERISKELEDCQNK
ncbi:MAG TPA: hypothetical protein ACFCUD_09855 [Cyclobacteriaceae bacterium]